MIRLGAVGIIFRRVKENVYEFLILRRKFLPFLWSSTFSIIFK